MANKDDVINFVKDVSEDMDSRIENLEAVKGKVFSDNVLTCLAIHSIFEVGSSAMPRELRIMLLGDLTAKLINEMLCKTVESTTERLEIIAMAKGISESMTGHAKRMTEMLKK